MLVVHDRKHSCLPVLCVCVCSFRWFHFHMTGQSATWGKQTSWIYLEARLFNQHYNWGNLASWMHVERNWGGPYFITVMLTLDVAREDEAIIVQGYTPQDFGPVPNALVIVAINNPVRTTLATKINNYESIVAWYRKKTSTSNSVPDFHSFWRIVGMWKNKIWKCISSYNVTLCCNYCRNHKLYSFYMVKGLPDCVLYTYK